MLQNQDVKKMRTQQQQQPTSSAHAGGGVSLDTNQRALRREMTELFFKKDTRAVKYNKPVE